MKMSLQSISRGIVERPIKLLIYGQDGLGKSTFAAKAPAPIFIDAEDGSNNLNVDRFPVPTTWQDIIDAVRSLTTDQHDYKSLIVDTLDAIEPLCWRYVCDKATKRGKEQIDNIEGFGYGRGYVAALDEWRVLLSALEQLWRSKGMMIILVAHSIIKPFKNPEGDDYDRYQLKIHDKAGGVIKEWTDINLFARVEAFANKKRGDLKAKGISTGARVIHTRRTAAYDAKNRYDLPETLPLDWDAFAAALKARQPADPRELLSTIEAVLAGLVGDPIVEKVRQSLKVVGDNAAELARINNKLLAMTSAKENAHE